MWLREVEDKFGLLGVVFFIGFREALFYKDL